MYDISRQFLSQVRVSSVFVREEAGTECVRGSGDASNSFAGERGVLSLCLRLTDALVGDEREREREGEGKKSPRVLGKMREREREREVPEDRVLQ